jgi:hypothetical protein
MMTEQWQPIATAPKTFPSTRVLLWADDKIVIGYWDAFYAEGGRGYTGHSGFVDDESEEIDPTHWMPLPAAPEGI